MAYVAPGQRYRDGLEQGPNPYLRWAVIEDVYEHDVLYPERDQFGGIDRDVPMSYARSVTVKWLFQGGGRSTVKFLEPWGVTSMPMKGSLVVVGFIGGPGGEPVILGFWTQGYGMRLLTEGGSGELGPGLRPGQEIWRRSGWRLRVIPYYTDVRKFAEQFSASPWSLDFIAGEQHDVACFCRKCQTRFPATRERDKTTGRIVLTCPTTCDECGEGKPVLVTGSVAGGEGEAWLAVQETLLVNRIMQELSDLYDQTTLGADIRDFQLQITIQRSWKSFRDNVLKRKWARDVHAYFESQVVGYWESILREYFTVGNLLQYAHDAPGQNSVLVGLLHQYVESWLYTTLTNQLMVHGQLSKAQRDALMNSLGENLRTYITEYTPRVIEQMVKRAIMNKVRVYLTEVVARLRRKAVNWLYSSFLDKAKDAALNAIIDVLDRDWAGFRKVRDTAANLVADFYGLTAKFDFAKSMQEALEAGLQDPEELPILELRGDQDVRSVLNPQSGREEGQGEKAARFRFKLYRDGEVHIQVQEGLFLYLRSDGTAELDCGGVSITADSLSMLLQNASNIIIRDVLSIGNPLGDIGPVPYKRVTLDEDHVREYAELGKQTTREFIQEVAWKHISGELASMFQNALVTPTDGGLTLKTNMAAALALAQMFDGPAPNSIIGRTEASAEHLEVN